MYDEHHDAVRTMLRRGILKAVNTSDADHQRFDVDGHVEESLKNLVSPMHYGFYSEPMPGASVQMLMQGGRSDKGHVIGVDDPRYRPKSLAPGASAIYDASGQIVSLVQRKIRIVSPDHVVLKAATIHLVGTVVTTDI
jgi:phage baseplate assembly protein V